MKKCTHCERELSDNAVVCVKCGYIQKPYRKKLEVAEVFGVPADRELSASPVGKLKTNRGLLKFLFLSLITFGIYGIVVMSAVSTDINVIASRYDGKKTMHYCLILFLFSWLTLGIAPLVWSHRLCARIGAELGRRGIGYRIGAGTFWGWGFFGSLILVGPFVYVHKLLKAMNLLAAHYNING